MFDFKMSEPKENSYTKEWLDVRGVYLLQVTGNKYQAHTEQYTSTPYVKFDTIDTVSGLKTRLMFWLPDDKCSEKAKEVRKSILNKFFISLGCNKKLEGMELLDDSINKTAKVALKEVEKIYYKKDTKEPKVVTELEFYFSDTADKTLTPKEEKMYVPLNDTQRKKFDEAQAKWREETTKNDAGVIDKPTVSKPTDDDLPF